MAALCAALAIPAAGHQQPVPSPSPTVAPLPAETPVPAPATSTTPAVSPTVPPTGVSPTAEPSATAQPTPTASPTPPPLSVSPDSLSVPVGATRSVQAGGVYGTLTATLADPQVGDVRVDTQMQRVDVTGRTPGTTTLTLVDSRGVSRALPVRVAYNAGQVNPYIVVELTGDPATRDYVREQVVRAITEQTQLRPGAQIAVGADDVPFDGKLMPDDVANVNVGVLLQGENLFDVEGTTRVHVENVAAPRISPSSLMVSDYPETLTENGILFTADLERNHASRFLYFHYNPKGQPNRRIVLRAENRSSQPSVVQFTEGRAQPDRNEMKVGHESTVSFLQRELQNEGLLYHIGGNSSVNLVMQSVPENTVIANMLQLRVLSGSNVHLTLFAQDASDDPNAATGSGSMLQSSVRHARGIYSIPEFYYSRQWDVTGEYLELPIGHIPLPNALQGEALAGDYGVVEHFTVNITNPTGAPARIAIYENPRGGSATGTYLIDGVLVQSHQTPAFSRYKIRQYVIPAKGFVRVTITTLPESGSNYPLRLVFAPDDGSVAPGAPGSPVY